MPGVILQKISPDSITISMAASASQQPFNGNGHSHSPSRDEYRYQDGDEPYSPTEDSVLQDSMLSQSQQPSEPNQERPLQSQPQGNSNLPSSRRHSGNPGAPQDPAPTASPVAPPLINRNARSQAMSNQDAQLRPPASLDDGRQGGPNRRVSRLESPSVLKSVLQPLEKKINEYDRFMTEARSEMAQLDDELRALQERRQQAEDRFLSAKSKHDDYSRQHEDVGRAMRGELVDRGLTSGTMSGPPQHEPIHPQPVQRAVSSMTDPSAP
ncbi:unnamed protein product [Clonostachys rosea f. rosea IK726]|uniref:Uncharacterized protein n=1 Tax=Clonostachys rosea f. rosea IK726 TaxID=1349383 RepID=A0ACA9UF16_BIOOC|nr:unnamed protein product [Clonostachys rosea f. rosea IK726]